MTVARGDLTAVVVADGTVQSRVQFTVGSPRRGQTRPAVQVGEAVRRGTPLARVDDVTVTSPGPGRVVAVAAAGEVVTNEPLVVIRYAGFGVSATVSPEDMFRIYETPQTATVAIRGGATGVECTVVPAATSLPAQAGEVAGAAAPAAPGGSAAATCLLPLETVAYEGVPAKLGLRTGQASGVLTLPVTAVSGQRQQGEVLLLPRGGSPEVRSVQLGISDGVRIEIVKGLAAGDIVSAQPPGFP
ncbi:hypothetical protein OO014_12640 [Intrasporangium calvum]|uniref:Multidrug resistance protein MdtA-like C-terminal permuted SH3 domain-containing protein n=1 Tax=Intrasporangium calvum TaxID=53358 RepID=A0ABT5GIS6_9MICO|nr:hypothetical protein [Intrasporangium calvum]MDC5698107.1 hypothetical protein [Intrasporangium calvum]